MTRPTLRYSCSIAIVLFACSVSAQWKRLPGPTTGTSLVHDFAFAGKIFISGTDKTAYTSDNGETWTDVMIDGYPISFIFMAADQTKVFGVAPSGAYVSLDSGKTWLTASNGLPRDQYDKLTVICGLSSPKGLFLGTRYFFGGAGVMASNDFGNTWKSIMSSSNGITCLGMYNSVLYALDGGNIRRSTDPNTGWDDPFTIPNESVTYFQQAGNFFFAGTTTGLFRLNQDKVTWKRIVIDGADHHVTDIATLGNTMCLATKDGLYISEDLGESWAKDTSSALQTDLYSVSITPTHIYAGGKNSGLVFIKDLAAATWSIDDYFATHAGIQYVGWAYDDLIAETATGLFSSGDRGQTWQQVFWTGYFPSDLQRIYTIISLPDTLIVQYSNGKTAISSDSGRSWTLRPNGLGYSHNFALLKSSLFILTQQSILRSTDMGMNWTTTSYGLSEADLFTIGEIGDSLVAMGKNEIYYSTDTGATWHLSNFHLGSTIAFGGINNSDLYFYSHNDACVVYRHGAAGPEYPPMLQKIYPNYMENGDIFFKDSTIIVVGIDRIVYSVNNGRNWSAVIRPGSYPRWFTANDSLIFGGADNGLYELHPQKASVSSEPSVNDVITISVSPNPTTDAITLDLRPKKPMTIDCAIYSITGVEIMNVFTDRHLVEATCNTIDVRHLPAGSYLCIIRSAEGSSVSPFAVVR